MPKGPKEGAQEHQRRLRNAKEHLEALRNAKKGKKNGKK